jgi:hypothetical protein
MALTQTDLPELKRFTFFVSRRFEEGRERFRLHMGYFATLAEAEEWLSVVRDIYPGAWAGEAPGRKLRERAAAAAVAQAQHAAGPQPQLAPAAHVPPADLRVPVVHAAPAAAAPRAIPRAPLVPATNLPGAAPAVARAPAAAPLARSTAAAAPRAPAAVPVVAHAPAVTPRAAAPAERVSSQLAARAAAAPAAKVAPAASAPAPSAAAPAAAMQRAAAAKVAAAARVAAAPPRKPAPPAAPVKAATAAAPAAAAPAAAAGRNTKPVFEDSNVREVLKALGDASATGETRLMRAPPPPLPPPPAAEKSSLSDTQVLKLLETRRPENAEPVAGSVQGDNIPLLKPDDSGTRRALKDAVVENAPVYFAVQLQWSVQAVQLDTVPPLAIFSAYTLYTVEGSREGRKWYGLRLGFFSDAISAKQVAHYVRSEFASVAVVPVSPQERSRASDEDKKAATLAAPAQTRSGPVEEFKLIDASLADGGPVVPKRGPAPQPPAGKASPKVAVGRMVRPSAAPKGRSRPATPGKVGARDKQPNPNTMEETLEILGAGQLSIDSGNGERINDSGVRHLRVEVQKNSPFSKLLERLSERVRKA